MRRAHTVRFAASISFLTVLVFVSLAGPALAQEPKPRPITPREASATANLQDRRTCLIIHRQIHLSSNYQLHIM